MNSAVRALAAQAYEGIGSSLPIYRNGAAEAIATAAIGALGLGGPVAAHYRARRAGERDGWDEAVGRAPQAQPFGPLPLGPQPAGAGAAAEVKA